MFNLTFDEVLKEFAKDKNKIFQGENYLKGVTLKVDNFGFLFLETYYQEKLSTDISDFVLNVNHICNSKFREILNIKDLF